MMFITVRNEIIQGFLFFGNRHMIKINLEKFCDFFDLAHMLSDLIDDSL